MRGRIIGSLALLATFAACDFDKEVEDCIGARTCIDETLITGFYGLVSGRPVGSTHLDPQEQRIPLRWVNLGANISYQLEAAPCPTGEISACPFSSFVDQVVVQVPEATLEVPLLNNVLHTGRYAFRVRGCRRTGDLACGPWSDVRYVRAGHPSGPTPGDLDGDGAAEFAVGDPDQGNGVVYLYDWSAADQEFLEARVTGVALGFGTSVVSAGDLNGDGVGDLVAGGAPGTTAYAMYGNDGDLPSAPDALALRSITFPAAIAPGGDFNADGYADVLISETIAGEPRVHVYFGSATGLTDTPTVTLLAPSGAGVTAMTALDLDGDRFDDVVLGGAGSAYVFFGRATVGDVVVDATLAPQIADPEFGGKVIGAGDVDGDGFPEAILPGTNGAFYVVAGGNGRTPSITRFESDQGAIVAMSAGYFDSDAWADVFALRPGGVFNLYEGHPDGLVRTPSTQTVPTLRGAAAAVGDLDGDGAEELVVSSLIGGAPRVSVWWTPIEDTIEDYVIVPGGTPSPGFGNVLSRVR